MMVVIKMKKLLVLVILIFCVCGCNNNQYDDLKHYDLKDRDTKTTVYQTINDKTKQEETYVVTDITPKDSEASIDGLFYKISDNNYIKLDEFESCNSSSYKHKNENYFSEDKLYITRCSGGRVYEYTLDGINTKKKDLSSIVNLYMAKVKEIKNGYVYFEGEEGDFSGQAKNVRCSIEKHECENID